MDESGTALRTRGRALFAFTRMSQGGADKKIVTGLWRENREREVKKLKYVCVRCKQTYFISARNELHSVARLQKVTVPSKDHSSVIT